MKIRHEMIDSHPNLTFYGIISATCRASLRSKTCSAEWILLRAGRKEIEDCSQMTIATIVHKSQIQV